MQVLTQEVAGEGAGWGALSSCISNRPAGTADHTLRRQITSGSQSWFLKFSVPGMQISRIKICRAEAPATGLFPSLQVIPVSIGVWNSPRPPPSPVPAS